MRKNGLLLTLFLTACMLIGCTAQQNSKTNQSAKPTATSTPEPVQITRFAEDYLGLTLAQIESMLGSISAEEYYNGGLIFRFKQSDIWFGFGSGTESYPNIPKNSSCVYILAPLTDAAAFDYAVLTKEDISKELGYSFEDMSYDEHDGIYQYYAEKGNTSCLVSCSEDGTILRDTDFVTYIVRN